MIDTLVCGAGPAGAVAAILLARGGARVRLVDRARFPRAKPCGDTVNPGAVALLTRFGLAHAVAGALPVEGMIVTALPAVRVEARYGSLCGRALPREAFDAALLRAAGDAGVEIDEGVLVQGPIVEDGRVRGFEVAGRNGRATRMMASMCIAADGGSSRIARSLGLARHATRPRRWAVGGYFTGVRGLTACGEMHVRSGRYLGVAPLPGGLANACVVTADRALLRDPVRLLDDGLHRDPLLADRFAGATAVARPYCLGPLAVESRACGMPGLLLAGDAAGFIDPMTGDGLRFALCGAELAARETLRALEHGTGDAHERLARARRREFSPKWRFNRALRALVASPLAVRAAAGPAGWSALWLPPVIRYAGDLRAA